MNKFYWIPFISPYVAGILAYMVLKILQKTGKLKRFDKYLWSPLVISGMVFLLVFTILTYHKYGAFWFLKIILERSMEINDIQHLIMFLISLVYFIVIFSQTIWISLIFQILSITKNNRAYLNIAMIFAFIGIFIPLILEIFVGVIS